MDWPAIIAGSFAGGLAGQLVTLVVTERLVATREHRNWLRERRFEVFSELIELVSASAPRSDYEDWPTNIRSLCQKAHLLFPGGTAPKEISDAMEKAFQLARKKKKNQVTDHDAWTIALRDEARILREGLSQLLHHSSQ